MKDLTLRVYALIENGKGQLLLSDETYQGRTFIKFPGGGWEVGETPIQTVLRELKEELGWDVRVEQLVHMTEAVIQSSFDPNKQVLAVYYRVTFESYMEELPKANGEERFYWCDKEEVLNHLTFETDCEAFTRGYGQN